MVSASGLRARDRSGPGAPMSQLRVGCVCLRFRAPRPQFLLLDWWIVFRSGDCVLYNETYMEMGTAQHSEHIPEAALQTVFAGKRDTMNAQTQPRASLPVPLPALPRARLHS